LSATGSFTLIIRDENLVIEDISKYLGLKPTKSKKKGEIISKAMNSTMKDNLWQYQVGYSASENPNNVLRKFLTHLVPKMDYIHRVSEQHDVYFTWFLHSDYAQMGASLEPETLKLLAELALTLEIHILSWGGVED